MLGIVSWVSEHVSLVSGIVSWKSGIVSWVSGAVSWVSGFVKVLIRLAAGAASLEVLAASPGAKK